METEVQELERHKAHCVLKTEEGRYVTLPHLSLGPVLNLCPLELKMWEHVLLQSLNRSIRENRAKHLL